MNRPNPLGWLEFLAWLRATSRRNTGRASEDADPEVAPGRWDDPVSQDNRRAFDEVRERIRRGAG